MGRPTARFIDCQCAAEHRLGLGNAVGILQQARQIVEAGRKLGLVRPKARFGDLQCAAEHRLGLGNAVGGLQQARQIVELCGNLGIGRPKARFIDCQCAAERPFRLGNAVGIPQQDRQIVEAGRKLGMVRPEARFIDLQCAAEQGLGSGIARLALCEGAEGAQYPCQRQSGAVGKVVGECREMRGERQKPWPGADVARMQVGQRGRHQVQTGPLRRAMIGQVVAGHLADQAVKGEGRAVVVAGDHRIARQFIQRVAAAPGGGLVVARDHVEQAFGDRRGREKRQQVQKRARGRRKLSDRRQPCCRDRQRIAGLARSAVGDQRGPVPGPLGAVGGKAAAAAVDIGGGLNQHQRQAAKVIGQKRGRRTRAGAGIRPRGRLGSALRRGVDQQIRRSLGRQQVQRQRRDMRPPDGQAAGDQDMAAAQPVCQRFGRLGRRLGIDVVEDQEPARVG